VRVVFYLDLGLFLLGREHDEGLEADAGKDGLEGGGHLALDVAVLLGKSRRVQRVGAAGGRAERARMVLGRVVVGHQKAEDLPVEPFSRAAKRTKGVTTG
jgi:hypothetical protein